MVVVTVEMVLGPAIASLDYHLLDGRWFGGGGGNQGPAGARGGYGGLGGGGAGTKIYDGAAGTWCQRTGGGGGGGGGNEFHHSSSGGHGGGGIVVVRYKIGSTNISKSNWWFISFYNGKTIHTFTTSGTFNNTDNPF